MQTIKHAAIGFQLIVNLKQLIMSLKAALNPSASLALQAIAFSI